MNLISDLPTDLTSGRRIWATDSSFWTSTSLFPTTGGNFPFWVLLSRDGSLINEFPAHRTGEFGNTRNGKTLFNLRNRNGETHDLYVYDLAQQAFTDSIRRPVDPDLQSFLGKPIWLNDRQIILHLPSRIVLAGLDTEEYRVLKEYDWWDCHNYTINDVEVIPNRQHEILYVVNQFFYNTAGEYRKKHEIIHLNVETGEERVLLIEL